MGGDKRLTEFLLKVLELKWSDFKQLIEKQEFSALEATIVALIEVCAKGNLRAIQEAFDRTDGKVAKQIQVDFPKFYYLYPNATMVHDDPAIIELPTGEAIEVPQVLDIPMEPSVIDAPLPTTSLRELLAEMIDAPLKDINSVVISAKAIDAHGDKGGFNPKVKTVVVANLLYHMLTAKKPIGYILEVMEQIDGKVADKIKLLGDDIYIKSFDTIAPAGAKKNKEGVYYIMADNITNAWAARLDTSNDSRR